MIFCRSPRNWSFSRTPKWWRAAGARPLPSSAFAKPSATGSRTVGVGRARGHSVQFFDVEKKMVKSVVVRIRFEI